MTHNEKVLALLSDGKPHSHREIYGLYVVGHSRIADLRKRGHTIEMWREGDDYFYRLLLSDGRATPSAASIAEKTDSTASRRPPLLGSAEVPVDRVDDPPQVPSTLAVEQLSLEAA